MKQKGFGEFFAILFALVVVGAGAYYFGYQNAQKKQEVLPIPTAQQSETANWKVYRNNKYKFEFSYPPAWLLDIGSEDSPSMDIHINNVKPSEVPGKCAKGFVGLEIQTNLSKDAKINLEDLVNSAAKTSSFNEGGKIEKVVTSVNMYYKVERAGWDSPCQGPGFYYEQNDKQYTHVFSGVDDLANENDKRAVDLILASIKFLQ